VTIIKLNGRPNGRTLLAHGSTPLVYEQRVGLGKIIYLAFNPSDRALLGQPGYESLWRQILLSACSGRPATYADSPLNSSNIEELSREGMTANPPKTPMVAAFLGSYILLLVPINYFVLRRLRRKELAWITIPALVVVFSLAAYAAGSASREKKLVARSAQVIEMVAGSEVAAYHGDLSLLPPNRGRQTIRFPDPSALVSDTGFGGSAGVFPALESVQTRENVVLPDADLFMWSVRTLGFQGIRPAPGKISADLTTDGTRVRGTISSKLPFPLKDCILYGDRFHKVIGDMAPGAVVRIDEPRKSITKAARREPINKKQATNFAWRIVCSEPIPDSLTLSGIPEWAEAQTPVPGAKVNPPSDMAFIRIHPKWVNGPDGKVTASIAGTTSDRSSYYGSAAGGTDKGPRTIRLDTKISLDENTDCVMQYQLPSLAAPPFLSLYLELGRPASIRAQVYDNLSEKWVDIGSANTQSPRFAIPNPQRVIGLGGVVQVKIGCLDERGMSKPLDVYPRLAFQGQLK